MDPIKRAEDCVDSVVAAGVGDETRPRRRADKDGLHKRRGFWHYRLKVAGRWQEVSTRTKSYTEARKTRQKALQDQEAGLLPTDMAKWPFEKAAQVWLAGRESLIAVKSYQTEKERLTPLLKAFAGRKLADITADDIRGYQVARNKKVSPKTINLDCAVLRMILRMAKLWARVADDYKPLPKSKRGPGRALSQDQEKRLFGAASSKPDWQVAYCAALVAANTTARSCEIRGLRLADIDLIERTMSVRRASTKTDAGCRTIPLNESATWALARLLERARLLGATEREHYLLPAFRYKHTQEGKDVAGRGYDPARPMNGWRTAWRKLVLETARRAGREAAREALDSRRGLRAAITAWKRAATPFRGLRFHDLRHHCITRLAEAGVPEQTLMAIAGHVSREMLEHYSHIRMNAKREAVAAIDSQKAPAQAQGAPLRAN